MNQAFTVLITRRLRRGHEGDYESWLAEVLAFLHSTPGYDGAILLVSPDKRLRMITIRFQSAGALADWESSPRRRALIDAANAFSTAEMHVTAGLEAFFVAPGTALPPSRWKLCVIMVPLVYVLVNAVLLAVGPLLSNWPLALRLIPVISIMTPLLNYVGLPVATRFFSGWLVPRTTPA